MTISRRDFLAVVAVSSAAAAPSLAWARMLAPFDPEADPTIFTHGVASGDPLHDRVILWTRIEPRRSRHGLTPVKWSIARDPAFRHVVDSGFVLTHAGRDFTAKVDVRGLRPGTTYYYRFQAFGGNSPIGRTRTLPIGRINNLRLAVASCSNYPFGFFNAYAGIAQRADLDAVLHLGDYIYEYANGSFGDGTALGRLVEPPREMVSLDDYRLRHATYKSDPDLQEAHRQHPFITVWDDHESANDAWRGGAENHQPETEGDWKARKARSIAAYNEWMPIREHNGLDRKIFRRFRFGDLADLIMLDTRLYGRDRQAASPADIASINDPNRQLLGAEQEAWFLDRMAQSQADRVRWRLVGQQVMMAQLSLDFGQSIANADQWDGYKPARDRVYEALRTSRIDNVVVLTGDIHSSWGNDLTPNPFDGSYNPATGSGALGVEFVAPGVTSPFLFPDTPEGAAQAAAAAQQIRAISPHMKFVELFRRGYLLLDVDRTRVQGEWYFPQTIRTRSLAEDFGGAMFSMAGVSSLQPAATPSPARSNPSDPAP
jgi:alkaline phosphatase D